MVITKYKSFDLYFVISIVYVERTKPKGLIPSAKYGYKKYESFDLCFFIPVVYVERTNPKVFFWNII